MATSTSRSPRRLALLAAAFAAVVALALLGAPQGPASPSAACRSFPCQASVAVGNTAVRWRAPETFYPNNEQLYADVSTAKGSLSPLSSSTDGCKHRFFGGGMSVVLKACGQVARLNLRAVRLKAGTRNLTVRYAATPLFDGAPTAPPSTGTSMRPLTPAR